MNRILDEVHETAKDMREAGVISHFDMLKFDVLCLPNVPGYSPKSIKDLRASYHLTQKNMAALLNISVSTLQKWETGAKKPVGAARKLLHLLETKGVATLL